MKKRTLSAVLMLVLLLAGCTPAGTAEQPEDGLRIVASTYPVYLFASAVTQGVEGVTVERLDTGGAGCLHDYTLTVNDMKKIEKADVLVLNGAGLEEFMEDALAAADALVIDCSEGEELLENLSHHHEEGDGGHDHGHWDPHYWLHPLYAGRMVSRIQEELSALAPEHEQAFSQNAETASGQLSALDAELTGLFEALEEKGGGVAGLITFHDGFQYFAWAYGLPLLEAVEEEAGSEASAKEIVEITELVQAHGIPVIFTEVNGSDATAKAIARETGCQVAQLSMCMDGPDDRLSNYLEVLRGNARAIVNGFAGEEVIG